jgi:hypothetical protein
MDLISSAKAEQYTTRLNEAQMKKWERTGLLENLKEGKKNTVARVLENQAIEFARMTRMLTESSDVADIKGFQNIAFPVVRRVFAGLLANEIVGVQPMSGPVGLAYSLRFLFSQALATGDASTDIAAGNEVFGNNSKTKRFYSVAPLKLVVLTQQPV